MSISKKISDWKERAEIDYIPLFMSLWLCLNAWVRDRIKEKNDREMINFLKHNGLELRDKFAELMSKKTAESYRFIGNFGELYRALNNAEIYYTQAKLKDKKVSFESCVIDWKSNSSKVESLKTENHQDDENEETSIQIDQGLHVENDNFRLFAAYIEILYQVRCALFHGDLAPTLENEKVIKGLYLTLFMIMEDV